MEYGYTSLLPPLLAIVLALLTRHVLLPLAAGILLGAGLLAWGTPESGLVLTTCAIFVRSIWDSVWDGDHLRVLVFTLLLGMMVGVIEVSGAMKRTIARFASRVRDRRGAQGMIAATGLAVFFDDYANTLLVGGTMRSTSDRFGLSRAKLAYLVDSTAAPVAGLALVSTWVATELSYLQAGIDASVYSANNNEAPIAVFDFFLQSIPYRFYPWFALFLVFVIARTGRDFGPMHAAEQAALKDAAKEQHGHLEDAVRTPDPKTRWSDMGAAFSPVLVCLAAVLATLIYTGMASLVEADASAEAVQEASGATDGAVGWLRRAGDVIGSGDSYLALMVGGGAGLATALLFAFVGAGVSKAQVFRGVGSGAAQMMPAMYVLWLAWALSAMTGKEALDTGGFLASVLTDAIDIRILPTCVFLLAGVIAFSTGTSWGTMAIVTPIAVSLVLDMQANSALANGAVNSPLALATFSGVLAGAIFGDHCSPISDTTVLSSRACDCDHVVHVRTQMPYALLAGGVCVVTGTLPVAFGVPVWLCWAAGAGCLVAAVRWLGRQPSV
ncbi:MAG: Na+/H+ antiporter NhaC family protein [Rhodopirellula sp. JB044]|uniref:Na+/H+ antiporter NhaC family protein n=1 Tax=Rhodopirellula sp. JB044 TaxID=3342844 RepID=UPI00370A0717